MARIAVPTEQRARVSPGYDRSLGIQFYDGDNFYPQRVDNAIASSGTATACATLFSKHLRGRGFLNPDIENLVVNDQRQTLGSIHKLVCDDRAKYRGYSYWVGYNAMLEVISIKHIPFKYCRLPIPDPKTGVVNQIFVHPDWMRENLSVPFKVQDIKKFDLFSDGRSVTLAQINVAGGFDKWQGQVVWFSDAGHLQYPPAVIDPVFEDVLTEAGIKGSKYRTVENNFNSDYMFVHRGDLDEDQEEDLKSNLKKHMGSKAEKVMLVISDSPDLDPQLVKFDKIDNDKIYEHTEDSVFRNTVAIYNQPLALHARQAQNALGGDMNIEWEKANINYDKRTEDERVNISKAFSQVLPLWFEGDPAIDGNYTVIPLTGLEDKKQTKSLADTLLVGALQEIRATIVDTTMTSEQKVNYLVFVIGVDPTRADALINGTKINIE